MLTDTGAEVQTWWRTYRVPVLFHTWRFSHRNLTNIWSGNAADCILKPVKCVSLNHMRDVTIASVLRFMYKIRAIVQGVGKKQGEHSARG